MSNNNIINLYPLRNLKKLTSLNLESNLIENNASSPTGERFDNLNIIANLHPNRGGALKKIYLSNNPGIINFTSVSSLTWEASSGF